MKKNVGLTDKMIRLLVAVALLVVYFLIADRLPVFGLVLLIVSVILGLTSFFGVCPAYLPFGISTCKRKEEK